MSTNTDRTKDYFNQWANYAELVKTLDTYRHTTAALNGEIYGRVLDVGNGGTFNYDTNLADQICVLDLAVRDLTTMPLPLHVSFQVGDALSLPYRASSFDVVLLQMLLHHLAEKNFADTTLRTNHALRQAFDVLRPGGKLVIIESCLPKVCEILELFTYQLFCLFVKSLGHPLVYQWSVGSLVTMLKNTGFSKVDCQLIPRGKWIIQFGRRWPTALTPVIPYKIVAEK